MRLLADAAVLPHTILQHALLTLEGGRIAAIEPAGPDHDADRHVRGTLLPGAIDLQVNGAGGHDVAAGAPADLDAVARAVAAGGAAAFLPTVITGKIDALCDQLAAVARWIDGHAGNGALPLGIHMEGPFLEVGGAHDVDCFVDPTPERIDRVLAAAAGHLRLVTLAPGRPGAAAAVARLRAAGVAVSFGHARDTEALEACVAAGAGLVTHLFNAMDRLHHREPGLAGRALDDTRLRCCLIVDGEHVHPAMVRNAWRILGPDRTVLVTDAVAAAGMPDGDYRLADIAVTLRDGVVRDAEGRLAGSALTMAGAVRRFLEYVPDAGPWSVARVVATNPADVLGLDDVGALRPGARALFGVLDDAGMLSALRLDA